MHIISADGNFKLNPVKEMSPIRTQYQKNLYQENRYANYADTITHTLKFRSACDFYGLSFNLHGFAKCPFHSEKTASFAIKGNNAHCFGCGWSGDIIDFVRKLFDESFISAVQRLNRDFALGLPIGERLTIRQRSEMARRRREIAAQRAAQAKADRDYKAKYDMLWDLWCYYDGIIRDYRPVMPGDDIDSRYADALQHIEYINYRINSEL